MRLLRFILTTLIALSVGVSIQAQDVDDTFPIQCGDRIEGVFVVPDQTIEYTFEVYGGERIEVLIETYGRLVARAILLDPDRAELERLDEVTFDQFNSEPAAEDGVYTVRLSNIDRTLGGYFMALECGFFSGSSMIPMDGATPPYRDPVVQQNGVMLSAASSVGANSVLGSSEVRLYAPDEPVAVSELFVVRLEIQLTDLIAGATPTAPFMPGEMPQLALQGSERISAYQYMGAELRGADLSFFQIEPAANSQVLRLSTTGVNFWEWEVRAPSAVAIGARYLQAYVYAPTTLDDGSIGQQEVYRARFSMQVTAANAPTQQVIPTDAATVSAPADPDMRIVYSSRDSLTLIGQRDIHIASLRLRSSISELVPAEDFDVLERTDYRLESGMCLHYVRYESSPPVPLACDATRTFPRVLNDADVNWHSRTEARLLDLTLYYRENRLLDCSGIGGICAILLPGL